MIGVIIYCIIVVLGVTALAFLSQWAVKFWERKP